MFLLQLTSTQPTTAQTKVKIQPIRRTLNLIRTLPVRVKFYHGMNKFKNRLLPYEDKLRSSVREKQVQGAVYRVYEVDPAKKPELDTKSIELKALANQFQEKNSTAAEKILETVPLSGKVAGRIAGSVFGIAAVPILLTLAIYGFTVPTSVINIVFPIAFGGIAVAAPFGAYSIFQTMRTRTHEVRKKEWEIVKQISTSESGKVPELVGKQSAHDVMRVYS